MKKFTMIFGSLMVLGIAGAFAMSDLIVVGKWHYKITVNVETPEGLKTGSAVREVKVDASKPLLDLPEATAHKESKGEAVVVDLGRRGVVFALTSFDDYQVVFSAFPGPPGTSPEGVRYYSALKNVKATLRPEDYPQLVAFRDLKDPKSVVSLRDVSDCMKQDQNGTCIEEKFHVTADRFEEIFGKGVKLKDIKIEMTGEPITRKVDQYLSQDFWNKFQQWWVTASLDEKTEKARLFEFKQGAIK